MGPVFLLIPLYRPRWGRSPSNVPSEHCLLSVSRQILIACVQVLYFGAGQGLPTMHIFMERQRRQLRTNLFQTGCGKSSLINKKCLVSKGKRCKMSTMIIMNRSWLLSPTARLSQRPRKSRYILGIFPTGIIYTLSCMTLKVSSLARMPTSISWNVLLKSKVECPSLKTDCMRSGELSHLFARAHPFWKHNWKDLHHGTCCWRTHCRDRSRKDCSDGTCTHGWGPWCTQPPSGLTWWQCSTYHRCIHHVWQACKLGDHGVNRWWHSRPGWRTDVEIWREESKWGFRKFMHDHCSENCWESTRNEGV